MLTKRILPIALTALVLSTASGCSKSSTFELTVTVISATDCSPVAGARVTPVFVQSFKDGTGTAPTDTSGRFTGQFLGQHYDFIGDRLAEPWGIKIERDGFVPQVVNIKPTTDPTESRSPIPLNVTVRLEPVKKP